MKKWLTYTITGIVIFLMVGGLSTVNFFTIRHTLRTLYPDTEFNFTWFPFGYRVESEQPNPFDAFQMVFYLSYWVSVVGENETIPEPEIFIEQYGNDYWSMVFIDLRNYEDFISYNWTISIKVIDDTYFNDFSYLIMIYTYEANTSDPQTFLQGVFDDFYHSHRTNDYF